jgi:hypothetical protein
MALATADVENARAAAIVCRRIGDGSEFILMALSLADCLICNFSG